MLQKVKNDGIAVPNILGYWWTKGQTRTARACTIVAYIPLHEWSLLTNPDRMMLQKWESVVRKALVKTWGEAKEEIVPAFFPIPSYLILSTSYLGQMDKKRIMHSGK